MRSTRWRYRAIAIGTR
jgi:transposase